MTTMQLSQQSLLSLARDDPPWLREKRLRAWDSFSQADKAPFLKYGLSILTPLDGLIPEEIESSGNILSCEAPAGVQVSRSPSDQRIFSSLGQDRFASLHTAFCTDILHIRVPDHTELSAPVILRKTMGGRSFFEHVFIELGKNCKAAVLDSLDGHGGLHSGGTEIFLGEGSSLLFAGAQNLSPETNSVSLRTARLQKDATLTWLTVDEGSRLTLSRTGGVMAGQGSSLFTKMMVYGTGQQHFDLNISSVHAAPDTVSDIVLKSVLDGRARMVANGLVRIEKNAPRSNGYQKEDTLLLSPDAEAAPIPNLEIDNNDVRCTHGTTVGQIDKNILFYLMARGLDRETATRLVVAGFFEPLIAGIPLQQLQEEVRATVQRKLAERRPEEDE